MMSRHSMTLSRHQNKLLGMAGSTFNACKARLGHQVTTSVLHVARGTLVPRTLPVLRSQPPSIEMSRIPKTIDRQSCITAEFKPKGANVAWNVNHIFRRRWSPRCTTAASIMTLCQVSTEEEIDTATKRVEKSMPKARYSRCPAPANH